MYMYRYMFVEIRHHYEIMKKILSKAIMLKTKLKIKFLKHFKEGKKIIHQGKKLVCTSLKKRKKYFANLKEKSITDNKILWQAMMPFLSEKTISKEKITLTENENMVLDDSIVSNCLNNFFF